MKKFLLFAAAAALFAACASDELNVQNEQQTAQDDGAITFDAYMQRSVTRAGVAGEASSTALQSDATDLGKAGFGVFAYYTDNFDYTPLYQPNFMYNEHVKWDGSAFKYDLTKYWPNEHGSQAQSADQDRVSFFAYAPYVEVDPSTGMLAKSGSLLEASDPELQWGITGMKRNTLQGDPVIQYISSFEESKCVDLCWGTTGSTDVTWGTNGSTQTIKAGYPWLNVRKPNGIASDAKVKFNFQHALARLKVNVKTDFTGGWETTEATKTKVWVRSIRFTGIAHKAALNLNNPKTMNSNKARWIDYYGTNELELGESVTVYDGRKDGSEGVLDAIAPNEAVLGLNPVIVQVEDQVEPDGNSFKWKSTSKAGVTTADDVNAFNTSNYVYVIPTGEKITVEIVYDIETIDEKLPTLLSDGETPGSSVENRISKAISFGTGKNVFENGKSYVLNLILGMKDVKFTADVVDGWGDEVSGDAYLPNNLPSYAAANPGSTTTAYVAADATEYKFAVTGLNKEEVVAITGSTLASDPVVYAKNDFSGTTGKASASGVAFVKAASFTANTDVVIKSLGIAALTGDVSGNKANVTIVQLASPLGLEVPDTKTESPSYIYKNSHNDNTLWQKTPLDPASVAPYVKVWVDDVEYTVTTGTADTPAPGASEAYFNTNSGKLTFNSISYPTEDQVIKITIKTGDAPAETKSFTVE